MTIERKVGMGIAGQPSGATDVADVFSTYLYTGTGSTAQTINNGIDLAGEGGMTWIKSRSHDSLNHVLQNSESGITKSLHCNTTDAENASAPYLTSYNSNGFTLAGGGWYETNETAYDYVSWTFRKKSGFFDCVTYTGNGVAGREIAHGLDGPVGMLIVKCTSHAQNWAVWNKGIPNTHVLRLNGTNAFNAASTYWNNTTPTNTVFTVGTDHEVNVSGKTYVAYLWADNSTEDAEDQMIKCGSYTGNGTVGRTLDLGWEPQWILLKRTDSADSWFIFDTAREQTTGLSEYLRADLSDEAGRAFYYIPPNPTGITFNATSGGAFNTNGAEYIYMAIRAPMMKEPEAATDVFDITVGLTGSSLPSYNSNFPVDMALTRRPATTETWSIQSRMTGAQTLQPNSIAVEGGGDVERQWDYMNGWGDWTVNTSTHYAWNWKRAKGYFDVVCYSGNTTAGRTVAHSLSVIPEMMWVKCRTDTTSWMVYHAALTGTKYLVLNTTAAPVTHNGNWNNTNPTDSVFTVGDGATNVAQAQIAYLFATSSGVSKVGSYIGNGTNQTIDCGFSAGSRFILIKRTDIAGHWYVWDFARGIVAGNDPHLSLKATTAQITSDDSVDPHNSGFIVNQNSATDINVSSGTYIFYAIA